MGKELLKQLQKFSAQYQVDSNYDSESFIKTKILIAHTGINHNGTKFSSESFEYAKASLANKPILARVVETGDGKYDFNGHDMTWEYDENKEDWKIVYLEQPIGVIPETNEYEIVEYDGREYVCAIGYVWREYTNIAEQIVMERGNIEVSMEISVEEDGYRYDEESGVYDIEKFKYRGVTMLGAHVQPAMEKAHAQVVFQRNDETQTTEQYSKMVEQLSKELSKVNYFSVLNEVKVEVENKTIAETFSETFNVDLKEMDMSQYKLFSLEEYAKVEQKIQQFEKQVEELEAYKANVEAEKLQAERDAIVAEYSTLLSATEVETIVTENADKDLIMLDYAFAKAYKEKAKNQKPKQTGVSMENANFSSSKQKAKKLGL